MTYFLFSGLAPIYLTTPTTGVVGFNSLGENFYAIDGIDPEFDNAVRDFMAANPDAEDLDEGMDDYSANTYLVGDWMQKQDSGEWECDPALPRYGFAAIHNVNEHTVQIVRSKWISKGRPASPCYPNQVDLETTGDYMGFDLPIEMYHGRKNENAIVEYTPAEEDN